MERESTAGHHEHLQNLCHRIVSHRFSKNLMGSYWEDSVSHHPKRFFLDFWGRFFVSVGIEVKRFIPIKHFTQQSTKSLGRPGSTKSLSSCCQVLKVWLNFQAWSSQRNTLILGKNQGWPHHFFGESRYSDQFDLYSFWYYHKNIINNSDDVFNINYENHHENICVFIFALQDRFTTL